MDGFLALKGAGEFASVCVRTQMFERFVQTQCWIVHADEKAGGTAAKPPPSNVLLWRDCLAAKRNRAGVARKRVCLFLCVCDLCVCVFVYTSICASFVNSVYVVRALLEKTNC